ncbi:hypothetical protein [Nocardiopsis ganjiahuensis]|uniref:hypothetical protein n=1 Tax=Nocardiopsis ganjiahuensis TaxID=239984 RepID=UPI00034C765E|nr:hypothetical protein [Nocardiopsis ganjiahuensis]
MSIQAYAHERTTAAYEALSALRDEYANLATMPWDASIRRTPGWGPSPEQLIAAGARWRAERDETFAQLRQGLKPIGASPSPIDLTIPSVLKDIGDEIGDLQDAVLERVAPDIRPARTVPTRIGRIINLLSRIGADDILLDHVTAEVRRMRARIKHARGESEEVRQLRVRCPICGARSLRELPDRGLVVCASAACRCDDTTCSCHDETDHRRHQWAALEGIPA